MKSKTSKYAALIIIILGVLFIYFIPLFFKADNSTENWPALENQNRAGNFKETMRDLVIDPIFGQSKYAGIDGELKQLFDEAEVIYLVDHIKLVETDKKYLKTKMYGTIVGIINKNNSFIRYKIGDEERIGDWYNASKDVFVPEGALLFLQKGNNYIYNAGNAVYFNYGKVASKYNGYTFEYIKEIFDNGNDK